MFAQLYDMVILNSLNRFFKKLKFFIVFKKWKNDKKTFTIFINHLSLKYRLVYLIFLKGHFIGIRISSLGHFYNIWKNVRIILIVYIDFIQNMLNPGWCGPVDWALACGLKGHWFDSQSEHKPAWVVGQIPGWGHARATDHNMSLTHWCFSLALSPFPSL